MSAVENEQNMKTVLLSRTAVALVSAMSLPANAAEWNVRVGGYMEQYVGYADNDIDFTSIDQIDESYMFIEGSFGEVLLGSANSTGYKMTVAARDVTFLNVNPGSLTMFIPFSGSVGGVSVGSHSPAILSKVRSGQSHRTPLGPHTMNRAVPAWLRSSIVRVLAGMAIRCLESIESSDLPVKSTHSCLG